jgi:TFIIH p62 subunit, N-terminal domain
VKLALTTSMDYEIERRASFEKKSGIVQLSPTHLVWTGDSAADGRDLRIAFTAVKQYQVSKAGGKKVRCEQCCVCRFVHADRC